MLCEFCHSNVAVHHQHRTSYGFASVCDPCFRATIGLPPLRKQARNPRGCSHQLETKTKAAGIGFSDTRPQEEIHYEQ
ncbi:hypothetical protein CA13_08290 [Planctomycetes bacterium CA13]|uniref:Uncharacterized protein n=1 Tax=Novipirellula herctigrandis TaxID=2527986 RepID=A0A5C5YWM0_9BACT|nr:hypothetical protein CA13_08290 [Planctomycetes bacterium CA13]